MRLRAAVVGSGRGALGRLGEAVRVARYAAVNEAVRLFTDQADRPS